MPSARGIVNRRAARWVGATIVFGTVCLGLAVWLGWWGAALFGEADEFYRSQSGSEQVTDAVGRYHDSLMQASYAMQDIVGPLFAGAVFAVLAALAVLALAWERREAAGP